MKTVAPQIITLSCSNALTFNDYNNVSKTKWTSIDSIERGMAPMRRAIVAGICWGQFDSSGCTHSWAEMTGVRAALLAAV